MNNPQLTPHEIGTVLGMSLVEGPGVESLHDTESQLIEGAGISKRDYIIERIVLRASAAAFALSGNLLPKDRAAALEGFVDWFENGAKANPALGDAYKRFQILSSVYATAATEDRLTTPVPGALHFAKLPLAYGDALASKASQNPSAEGLCVVLAQLADGYWSAQVQGSIDLFQRAGVV